MRVTTERGAVVFDMDDTLYPERRYALSAFAAVARRASRVCDASSREIFATLCRSYRRRRRAQALQDMCETFGIDPTTVGAWVLIMRSHTPRLRLPRESREALQALRSRFRLCVLTNGMPEVQARKVDALGLRPLVDAVVFAAAHGSGAGKPEGECFDAALRSIDASREHTVFVGDDPVCDIGGARAAGLRTIRVRRGAHAHVDLDGCEADATVTTIAEARAALERLMPLRKAYQVA